MSARYKVGEAADGSAQICDENCPAIALESLAYVFLYFSPFPIKIPVRAQGKVIFNIKAVVV